MSGDSSVNEPDSIEPYTSSVETWRKRATPSSRAASSSTPVPITCVTANGSWPAIERSTCDSAAKFTTRSQPSIALAHGRRVLDRALDELDPVLDLGEVLAPPRVRELVEHDHLVVGPRLEQHAHVGRADEPGGAGHERPHVATARSARYAARPSCQSGR